MDTDPCHPKATRNDIGRGENVRRQIVTGVTRAMYVPE
jgi:hypothetical protein